MCTETPTDRKGGRARTDIIVQQALHHGGSVGLPDFGLPAVVRLDLDEVDVPLRRRTRLHARRVALQSELVFDGRQTPTPSPTPRESAPLAAARRGSVSADAEAFDTYRAY